MLSESDFPSILTLKQFVRYLRKLNIYFNHLEITIVKEPWYKYELYKVQKVFGISKKCMQNSRSFADVYELQTMDENGNEKTCTHKFELLFDPTYLKSLKVPKNTTVSLIYS